MTSPNEAVAVECSSVVSEIAECGCICSCDTAFFITKLLNMVVLVVIQHFSS